MLQNEILWDQKPEKVQITSKVMNVDRTKDGQSLALGDPQEAGQSAHSVHTSKGRKDKPKCRKTRTSVHKCTAEPSREMKAQGRAAAEKVMPDVREARERERAERLHQT